MEISTLIHKYSKGTFPHANPMHGPSFLIPTTGELLPSPLAIFQWPQTCKTGSSHPPPIGAEGSAAGVAAGCGQSGRGWPVVALWRAPARHRPRMEQGADLMVGDLTTFASTVGDEAFYVEVNFER
jgi:hypothetical protein